ncbi:MAG TPA: nucleotidyltransferase family protein [Actinomycetota bacterium]|nr:nucleotidyltransferase family protein [Actinomycetota bacterium]
MSDDATDQVAAAEVFREVVKLLEEGGFDYAVGGGLATDHWKGGADHIADIDVMIREDDAEPILETFRGTGYKTAEMEHSWLHKAFKDGITIDVIYELANGARLDDRFLAHRTRVDMFGVRPQVSSAEDQVASLTATVDRMTIGQHWFSIIDLMANNDLEWDYVIARAQKVPMKMLSVVYFALSESVPIQRGVIDQLSAIADAAKEADA